MQALINQAEARYHGAPGLYRVDTRTDSVEHTPVKASDAETTERTEPTDDQSEGAGLGVMVSFGAICAAGVCTLIVGCQQLVNILARGAA